MAGRTVLFKLNREQTALLWEMNVCIRENYPEREDEKEMMGTSEY